MTRTYQDYFDLLGFKESSSIPGGVQNYAIQSRYGYIGKYQFGEAALFDLGLYGLDNSDSNLFSNDWIGNWSGKHGITSKQDFLQNGAVQEIIVRDWHEMLWGRIKYLGLDKYDGQVLNGNLISLSGMLAASHLIGTGNRSSEIAGLKGYLLSGAVFSPADGNGTTANEYMNLFQAFQTPFTVDHSQSQTIEGGASKDILTGFGGDDILIGKEDIDTARYHSNAADYDLEKFSNEIWSIKHKNGESDGSDTLIEIERIQFSDISLALDLNDNAGMTAKILGAVFGPESISNKTYAGIGLTLLDNDMNFEALMQIAIDTALGKDATNHAVVADLLYKNVVGLSPSAAEAAYYVEMLDNGTHTVSSIAIMAAETSLNLENIDLVGLYQTGLEYLPVYI